jgi:hypothetical protein
MAIATSSAGRKKAEMMASYRAFYISGPGRGSSWKDKLRLAVAALVGGAILVAAVILSLSLALILIPVGLIAYVFRRQILRGLIGSLQRGQKPAGQAESPFMRADPVDDGKGRTIEADYTVIDSDPRNRR